MNLSDKSAVMQERVERAIQLRYSPFPELTMELLSQQLNQFRIGELRPAIRTWEIMMERDGELSGPASKRFKDSSRLPWDIEKDDDSPEAELHAEALRYFYTHLTATSVLEQDETGGLNLLLRQMLSAQAYRYSVHEMVLQVSDAGRREVSAQFRHCPGWFFECRRGRLGFLASEGDVYGQPLERGQWLSAVGDGLMRPCSIAYAIKHFPLRDWLLFCSRFGVPGVQGMTDAAKGSKEWDDFCAAVSEFANNWITVTNRNAEIKLIESAKGSASLPFKELVERSDRLYARVFRGGDLSTQSRGGDAVGASLQDEEKDVMGADDAVWVTDTLNAGVDEPVIAYLFNAQPKAWFKLMLPKRADITAETAAMSFLTEHGCRVAKQTAHERLQVPEAQDDEEVLEAKAPVAAADGFGRFGNNGSEATGGGRGPDLGLGNEAALEASAQLAVTAAMQAQFQGLGERLARIMAINDDAIWLQSMQRFEQDLVGLTRDLVADPAAAKPMAEAAMAALLNGMGEAKRARAPKAE